jgi:hypothetical protein
MAAEAKRNRHVRTTLLEAIPCAPFPPESRGRAIVEGGQMTKGRSQ